MSAQTLPACARVDLMFRAFSDRTRLRILCLLQHGETCVGDMAAILEAPQPRVSRHLAYLRKSGLVSVRKSGQWAYYSLAAPGDGFHHKLLKCLRECFTCVPEVQADLARAARLRECGQRCC